MVTFRNGSSFIRFLAFYLFQVKTHKREAPMICRCGLAVPREKMVDYLCPECRLARILTEYDRPVPDYFIDTPAPRGKPLEGFVHETD